MIGSFSIKELCKEDLISIPVEHEWNLIRLHHCLNVIRRLYDKPLVVNSGYRTLDQHVDVYRKINDIRISSGLNPLAAPMNSCHLIGAAADISDPNGDLKIWTMHNENLLENLGLYCEDFQHTPSWVHYQTLPPPSGSRFFIP